MHPFVGFDLASPSTTTSSSTLSFPNFCAAHRWNPPPSSSPLPPRIRTTHRFLSPPIACFGRLAVTSAPSAAASPPPAAAPRGGRRSAPRGSSPRWRLLPAARATRPCWSTLGKEAPMSGTTWWSCYATSSTPASGSPPW